MKTLSLESEEIKKKSSDERIDLAGKVGAILSQSQGGAERKAAEELAKILAGDAAEIVRESLSESLLNCQFLPSSLVKMIANDIDTVSSDFLLRPTSFETQTLEDVARECSERAREILANRKNLPEPVSFAISEVGKEVAVTNLMNNHTAEISERVCLSVTDRFEDNEELLGRMALREDLPLTIVNILVERLSEDVFDHLKKSYNLQPEYAAYVAGETQSLATTKMMERASDQDLKAYLTSLFEDDLLNDGMLLRMIKNKETRSLTCALALRADISEENIQAIFKDGRRQAIFRLFEKANVGKGLIRVFYQSLIESE